MRHHTTSIVGPHWIGPDFPPLPERGKFPVFTAPTLCSRVERIEEVVSDMAQQVEALQRSDADPYPADVLAACPMAREWGVRLVTDRPEPVPFVWMAGELWWSAGTQKWVKDYGGGVRRTRAEALSAAPTTPPPGYVAPPAQPSVGERLGAVARDEWLATGAVARWDRIALAVRREVLKEVFAEEDVEAAAKAMWNATLPGITWDELREASRKPIWVQAAAALSAAIASRVARARKEKP